MEQEMVSIPKEVFEALREEIEILSNPDVMDSIRQNEDAKKQGVKTWDLQPRE